MSKPDPVQHMMTWGAISSGVILLGYFLLIGSLTVPTIDTVIFALLGFGIFGGFTLGGMAGVIIGTVFQHDQDSVSVNTLHNRRNAVVISVFMMVLVVSRILLVLAFGLIGHPLALSLLGAMIAALASQHYLYRVETWLKREKPKRKNDTLPQRLLDDYALKEDESFDNMRVEERHSERR